MNPVKAIKNQAKILIFYLSSVDQGSPVTLTIIKQVIEATNWGQNVTASSFRSVNFF